MIRSLVRVLGVVTAALGVASPTLAQCALSLQPGLGLPGVDGTVYASTMWDPDGAGPLPPRLVIGGDFTVAGTVVANRMAAYDQATGTWLALGGGITGCGGTSGAGSINGSVRGLVGMPNGDLVAAGGFTTAGGVAARNIAKWNGSTWTSLGGGVDSHAYSLAVAPNGDLFVGGDLQAAGTTPVSNIARWDGTSWSNVGGGTNDEIWALQSLPNGDLIAAGHFTMAGGTNANRIARWDGFAWSALGSGVDSWVTSLTTTPAGDLFVGGAFTTAGGTPANCIARWSGGAWSAVGSGVTGPAPSVLSLAVSASGDLIAGGRFDTAGALQCSNIARWDGANWSPLGAGSWAFVHTIATLPSGPLIAGGSYTTAAGEPANGLAEWNGSSWSLVGIGTIGRIEALEQFPNGDVYAGGNFTRLGATSARCVARWNGTAWSALGTGMSGGSGSGPVVNAIVRMPNGDLVAAGDFANAGGVAAANIARWNGGGWSALGSGTNQPIRAMVVLPNGDLVVGGTFSTAGGLAAMHVARWNGLGWSPLGAGTNAEVCALLATPSGEVLAGGFVGSWPSSGVVVRWNGSTWSQLGGLFTNLLFGGSAAVECLLLLGNGNLVAGGRFTEQGATPCRSLMQWNGVTWQPMGYGVGQVTLTCGPGFGLATGWVKALALLPHGDVIAGGYLDASVLGGAASRGLARWNGMSWTNFGTVHTEGCAAVSLGTGGDLLAAGGLFLEGSTVATGLARFQPTCPAAATTLGTGCTGSGGANVLTATSLPWIGATCTTRATGMPTLGLAVRTLGLGAVSIPLPSILPQGVAGCSLFVAPDLLDLHTPTAGTVTPALAIPNTLALVNRTLHQQVVAVELDALANIVAFTSTNALTLTIGAF